LGNYGPFDRKRLFPVAPKPGGPPRNETAASTGIEGGGNENGIGGDRSGDQDYYTDRLTSIAVPRIIALHWLPREAAHA
jgi:hypothetical protein